MNFSDETINSSDSVEIEMLENSTVDDILTEFINEATENDFLIENNEIVNAADLIMADNTLKEPSVAIKGLYIYICMSITYKFLCIICYEL